VFLPILVALSVGPNLTGGFLDWVFLSNATPQVQTQERVQSGAAAPALPVSSTLGEVTPTPAAAMP